MLGLVHIYWGEGKGKTTAAMGLALRALGNHKRVVVVQFLKGAQSGEIPLLERLGAQILRGKAGTKFVSAMTPNEKAETFALQTAYLQKALDLPCDLLILDEAAAAWQLHMVDPDLLKRAVLQKPAEREVVLTGRYPADWMLQVADYSTEMRCCKHPFSKGISAREGVEF